MNSPVFMNVHELFMNRGEFSFSLKKDTQTYFELTNNGGALMKKNGSQLPAAAYQMAQPTAQVSICANSPAAGKRGGSG